MQHSFLKRITGEGEKYRRKNRRSQASIGVARDETKEVDGDREKIIGHWGVESLSKRTPALP